MSQRETLHERTERTKRDLQLDLTLFVCLFIVFVFFLCFCVKKLTVLYSNTQYSQAFSHRWNGGGLCRWNLKSTAVDVIDKVVWRLAIDSASNILSCSQDFLGGSAKFTGHRSGPQYSGNGDDLIQGYVAIVFDWKRGETATLIRSFIRAVSVVAYYSWPSCGHVAVPSKPW